jgi:guanylate kinase
MNVGYGTHKMIPRPNRTIPIGVDVSEPGKPIHARKTEYPLLIHFGGATGAGKTILANFYAKEMDIGYDVGHLATEASHEISLEKLREKWCLTPDQRIRGTLVTKFTTRNPRVTEHDGIDFYFLSRDLFEQKAGSMSVTYVYPEGKDGELYGLPTSVEFPLSYGIDSIVTETGWNAFSKVAAKYPGSVGIWVNADQPDIESHIKRRAASDVERESRLESSILDLQQFYKNRHSIPYSVFIDSLQSLRVEINPNTERQVLQDMDKALRQVKAIVWFERYLSSKEAKISGIQEKFDYFVDRATRKVFYGMSMDDRLGKGHTVPVLDSDKDEELLENYSSDSRAVSRTLLDDIVARIKMVGARDINGRRTFVLAPYSAAYLTSINATEKKVVIDLLSRKLNGFGAHVVNESSKHYKGESLLSLAHLDQGLEEALYVHLSSDHIHYSDLMRPRSLNFVFSQSDDPRDVQPSLRSLSIDEVAELSLSTATDQVVRGIFQRSIQA